MSRAIRNLSPGAPSTVRVATCRDEQGRPEITYAVVRMASSPDVATNDFHDGGVTVYVKAEKLGRTTDMGPTKDTRWRDTHGRSANVATDAAARVARPNARGARQ